MTKFTKEQLISRARIMMRKHREMLAINPDYDGIARDVELFELALAVLTAGMEQEPVAWMTTRDGDGTFPRLHLEEAAADCWVNTCNVAPPIAKHPLYAAPQLPQPEVDEKVIGSFSPERNEIGIFDDGVSVESFSHWHCHNKFEVVIRPCRAAMLQGAEPVSQPYTLRDGWVAVPVEPTENMIIAGFEAGLREEFRDPEAWKTFEAMSGCEQAAHRAKLCWAAMIAAAPQQEADNG